MTTPLEVDVTLVDSAAKRATLNGARLATAEQLAPRDRDARLHAGPARDRQGRSGCAARVLRPRARATPAGACDRCRPTTRRRRAAERGASTCRRGALLARRGRAVDRAGRDPRRRARRRAARDARRARARLPRDRRRARACRRRRSPTRASRRPSPSSRRGSSATSSARRRASGPHLHDVRLLAGDRDLRGFGSQGEQRLTVLALLLAEAQPARRRDATCRRSCCSTTSSRSSTRDGGAVLAALVADDGPDGRHGDAALGAARRAGTARRGGTWNGSLTPSAASCRASAPQAEIGRVAEAWPAAVGRADRAERLAGAHRARRDAARAHELVDVGVRARRTSQATIRDALGELAPPKLRFVPGPLPEPQTAARRTAVARRPEPSDGGPRTPRPSWPRKSATKSSGIWSREPPRRASREPDPTALSDTLPTARKAGICRAFSLWPNQLTPRRTSRSSKASSRSGNGRACTSARPAREASTTSSTRWSTTPSTRRSPAATTASR